MGSGSGIRARKAEIIACESMCNSAIKINGVKNRYASFMVTVERFVAISFFNWYSCSVDQKRTAALAV
jgi:hypothetical protein